MDEVRSYGPEELEQVARGVNATLDDRRVAATLLELLSAAPSPLPGEALRRLMRSSAADRLAAGIPVQPRDPSPTTAVTAEELGRALRFLCGVFYTDSTTQDSTHVGNAVHAVCAALQGRLENERAWLEAAIRPTSEGDEHAEWSTALGGHVAESEDRPERLFLRVEAATTLVELERCRVTSSRPSARRLEGGTVERIGLTSEEARWVAQVLPLAIGEQRRRWPSEGR